MTDENRAQKVFEGFWNPLVANFYEQVAAKGNFEKPQIPGGLSGPTSIDHFGGFHFEFFASTIFNATHVVIRVTPPNEAASFIQAGDPAKMFVGVLVYNDNEIHRSPIFDGYDWELITPHVEGFPNDLLSEITIATTVEQIRRRAG